MFYSEQVLNGTSAHNRLFSARDEWSKQPCKPTKSPTECTYSNQEERHRDKMFVHSINVRTVTDDIGRRVDSTPFWYL